LKDLADSLGTNRNIEKGDYAWFVKVQEIKTKEYLLKTMEKELNQRVNERMVTLYNTFYADFQSAVALYARQNGYDLVVRAADEELKSETAAGIQHEIGLKIVHYYSPALDKTNQILEVMNRIYEKAKAARKNAGS
jgi:Skp family chaperone for outer membrane proteins